VIDSTDTKVGMLPEQKRRLGPCSEWPAKHYPRVQIASYRPLGRG
jgi:hypothetical protein